MIDMSDLYKILIRITDVRTGNSNSLNINWINSGSGTSVKTGSRRELWMSGTN